MITHDTDPTVSPPETPDHPRATLLLVDDDEHFLRPLTALLSSHGYSCDTALSGATAVTTAANRHYDAVLTDIRMPSSGGLELASSLAGMVPVVFLTGAPSLHTAVEAVRLGAVDYLFKPVRASVLLAVVERAVARGRALRELDRTVRTLSPLLQRHAANDPMPPATDDTATTRRGPPTVVPPPRGERWALLSLREREVATAFYDTPQIDPVARSLSISPNTVRNHLRAIYRKLGVHSQAELVAAMRQMHILPGE